MERHDSPLDEAAIVNRVRAVSMSFPEAYEEAAWVGVRWRVRSRTFAHVLSIIDGKPQAHARAVGSEGPLTVLTFRAPEDEVVAFRQMGPPFFLAGWGRDVVGVTLGNDTDWGHVGELLTESYRVLAPKALAARLNSRVATTPATAHDEPSPQRDRPQPARTRRRVREDQRSGHHRHADD